MEKSKFIKKFIITFIISFIIFYLIEHMISYVFKIDLDNQKLTWLGYIGFIVLYGFKTHIICCLLPFLVASYNCKHKKCKHNYCE